MSTTPTASHQVPPGRIVWARDARFVPRDYRLKLQADPILGGHQEPPYGIAVMPAGFDGRIREWLRFVMIDGTPRSTLAWKAVQEYCGSRAQAGCPTPEELGARKETHPSTFSRDISFQILNLSEFIAEPRQQFDAGGCSVTDLDARLEKRIVLLGGFYSREDLSETPWGRERA